MQSLRIEAVIRDNDLSKKNLVIPFVCEKHLQSNFILLYGVILFYLNIYLNCVKIIIMEVNPGKKEWTLTCICKVGIYIVVVLILGIILFWLCLKSILTYNQWPIYTETNIVSQHDAMFPSLTFCALSHGYKEDVLKVNN